MKLLLDESLPKQLISSFPEEFEVTTVQQMGWTGTENGELLTLGAENEFAVLVTADKGIEYQQDPKSLPITVVVLSAHRTRVQDLQPLIPGLLGLLSKRLELKVYHVGA